MIARVVILFDSISNSVFESQVYTPLLNSATQFSKTIIISFEKKLPEAKLMQKIKSSGFEIIIKKRIPFITQELLLIHAWWIKQFVQTVGEHTFFARGPHAGYIAWHAKNVHTQHILIQARGLCAEEYTFFNPNNSLLNHIRYTTLHRLERTVYAFHDPILTIEAVSPALKDYLIKELGCTSPIIIAHHDIPTAISPAVCKEWRIEMRQKLSIPLDAIVYCYNGSAKPWQCARESVEYVRNITSEKKHLLVLSTDTKEFEKLCAEYLPCHMYTILYVEHAEIYRYLALADFGILFRKQHLVNWVSRPTKALEYTSVGLKIIHNQTVAYIQAS